MIEVEGFVLRPDLWYSEDHLWVEVKDNTAYIGLDDFAQKMAGRIIDVDVPQTGSRVHQNESGIVTLTLRKGSKSLKAPISGTVVQVNEEVLRDPSIINERPYEAWILAVKLENEKELKKLVHGAEDVRKWLEKEVEEVKKRRR